MPPNLEAFIPGERLPDDIDVYNNFTFPPMLPVRGFIPPYPIRFVRKYPLPTPVDNGDGSELSVALACPTRGQLDLRRETASCIGLGNHSRVFLAPLTLPSTAAAPSQRSTVAVKVADTDDSERQMLRNEAEIYDASPRRPQEGWYHLPPIVPKFNGYYVPSLKAFDKYLDDEKFPENYKNYLRLFERVSPFLLLEPCGELICGKDLTLIDKKEIEVPLHCLHEACFVQGSMYNVQA